MLGRLFIGILKGLIVGGLLGFGLAKLGFAAPNAIVAYAGAVVTGIVVGLVAGKPIWAEDARIEAGTKAFAGALLGAGLMFVARKWLTMPVPVPLGELGLGPIAIPNTSLGEAAGTHGTLGGLAITSLAMIAAILGGFYEADNDSSSAPSESTGSAKKPASEKTGNKRIAADSSADEADEEIADEPEKRAKK
jgi:hypothetical protein